MFPMSLSAENNPKSAAIRGPQPGRNHVECESDEEALSELSSSGKSSEVAQPASDRKEVVLMDTIISDGYFKYLKMLTGFIVTFRAYRRRTTSQMSSRRRMNPNQKKRNNMLLASMKRATLWWMNQTSKTANGSKFSWILRFAVISHSFRNSCVVFYNSFLFVWIYTFFLLIFRFKGNEYSTPYGVWRYVRFEIRTL